MKIDISEIIADFPQVEIAAIVADGCRIGAPRSAELDALIDARERRCRERWGGRALSEIPGIAAWRRAYRGFGIRKTSYRSSVERLVKNVLAGRRLPEINDFVDCYNAVSLHHVLPAGADDLDRVAGDVAFRYARRGDRFVDMAAGGGSAPPKPGEVVYADAEKLLCRRWNWRQDGRSLVTRETRRAIVTIQANGYGDIDAAVADLCGLLGRFCGADCAVGRLDGGAPRTEIDVP